MPMIKEGKNLCIMGGTFNPIHNGHLQMAYHCLEKFNFDLMLFIPTGDPPHKKDGAGNKYHRLAMTRLALDGHNRSEVSDIEVEREKKTYTFDTLNQLKKTYSDWNFYYIIGADTLKELHTWYRFQDVARLTCFVLVGRKGTERSEQDGVVDHLCKQYGASIIYADYIGPDISSTDIREMVSNGESIDKYVPGIVDKYIKDHGLYK